MWRTIESKCKPRKQCSPCETALAPALSKGLLSGGGYFPTIVSSGWNAAKRVYYLLATVKVQLPVCHDPNTITNRLELLYTPPIFVRRLQRQQQMLETAAVRHILLSLPPQLR